MKAKNPPMPHVPDVVRCKYMVNGVPVGLKFPNTEANRAKSLGPVPFDMLHEAEITVTRGK